MSEHPQAAILRAIAEDRDATIQFRAPGAVEWGVCGVAYMLMHPAFIYRIAPKLDRYETEGYALAMRVLQSDLYKQLDDRELAECDEFIRREVPETESKPAEKVYYLWALVCDDKLEPVNPMVPEGEKPDGFRDKKLIRLDWSRTVIQEGK